MSNVFAIAAALSWQELLQYSLLGISIILWIAWLVKIAAKGGLLRGTPEIACRPSLAEVALAGIAVALFATLALTLFKDSLGSKDLESALAGETGKLLACLLVLILLGRPRPGRLKAFGLGLTGLPEQLAWGSLIALAIWPIATFVLVPASLQALELFYQWTAGLSYTPQEHALLREMGTASGPAVWLAVIAAVVVAPVTEEILFRGFLQGALVGLFRSRWAGIVLGALVFALLHLKYRETMPALFLLGLALGYAYEKSQSLYRPIAIHLAFNTMSVIVSLLSSS